MRAAASSIASGKPSRQVHSWAMSAALESVSENPGRASPARSTNSFTAECRSAESTVTSSGRLGNCSEGTGNSCSPAIRRGARLVTSILIPRHDANSSFTSTAASSTCSKLSITSNKFLLSRPSLRVSMADMPGRSARPSAREIVEGAKSPEVTGANPTKQAPSRKLSASSVATRWLRRVLPVPPGPVSVSRRVFSSAAVIARTSLSRPTKLVA